MTGQGRAPGKAILIGEHFVVHGAPALAVPVRAVSKEVSLSVVDRPKKERAGCHAQFAQDQPKPAEIDRKGKGTDQDGPDGGHLRVAAAQDRAVGAGQPPAP